MPQKQLREFGFILGFGFPILIGWLLPSIVGHSFKIWTLWVGIPSLLLGIMKPSLLSYPYKRWMQLGHALGWINSRIILGLVFVVLLQPIALIMKFFGYDPLREKKGDHKSYREVRSDHKIDLTRIF